MNKHLPVFSQTSFVGLWLSMLLVFGIMLSAKAQTTVTASNQSIIAAPFQLATTITNSSISACPYTVTVSIPEGAVILATNITYNVTAQNSGFMSEQRSYVRVTNDGGGVTPLQIGTGTGGTFNYVLNNTPIANGLSGDIDFQLHLFRTWNNGPETCLTTHQFIPVGGFTVSITYVESGTCITPFNLDVTNISNTSATVNWSPLLDETLEVSVGAIGHTPGLGDQLITLENVTTVNIENLDEGGGYEVFVRTVCENSNSDWSEGVSFFTLCAASVVDLSEPFFDDFEGCSVWNIVNGAAPNAWHVGSATNNGGNNSIYISQDGGVNNTYNVDVNSLVHFYLDFAVPEGNTEIFLNFDWKAGGESTFDYLRVFVAPPTFTPEASAAFQAGPVSNPAVGLQQLKGEGNAGNFNLSGGNWVSEFFQLPQSFAGETMRLIFTWRNDGSIGTQPPAAVDNISIGSFPTPQIDLQAVRTLVAESLCLNEEAPVGIRVLGYGEQTIDFANNPATFTVNITAPDGTTSQVSSVLNSGTLANGDFLSVVVGNFIPTQAGSHTFTASLTMVGDEVSVNNGAPLVNRTTVNNIVDAPVEIDFVSYTGGVLQNTYPAWTSVSGFNLAAAQIVIDAFNGRRAVRQAISTANIDASILSPQVEVEEGFIFMFDAALTGQFNALPADNLLPGDSIFISVLACGELESEAIWFVNSTNNPLTNQLNRFVLELDDYIGQTVQFRIGVRTVLASGGANPIRSNSVHFGYFYIGQAPSCLAPVQLGSQIVPNPDEPGAFCAQLSWEPANDDQFIFEVKWGAPGFDPETDGNLIDVTFENSTNLCNLPEGVQFQFYVRANCGTDGVSNYSGPINFLVPPPGSNCARPLIIQGVPYLAENLNSGVFGNFHNANQVPATSGCLSTFYLNGDEVVHSFTPTVSGAYEIRLFNVNQSNTALFVMEGGCINMESICLASVGRFDQTPREVILFLEAGTPYTVVVSRSTLTPSFNFSLSIDFIDCPLPTNVVGSPGNVNEVNISWNGFNAAEFDVIWGLPDFNPATEGTLISGVTNPFTTITGLADFSEICVYVRNSCENAVTDWVGPACVSVLCDNLLATVSLDGPFDEDFEADCVPWAIINGNAVNRWVIGEATNNGGSSSIYISNDGGTDNLYTINQSAIVHFYKDFQLNQGTGQFTVDFDWKSGGEGSFDFLRVFVAPTTFVPQAFSDAQAAPVSNPAVGLVQLGGEGNAGNFNLSDGNWESESLIIPEQFDGSVPFRIIFTWRNDGSIGTMPGAAVDNISVSATSTVGINRLDLKSKSFKVFPNPSAGNFNIVVGENIPNAHIEVFDLAGKMVFNKKANLVAGENHTLDLRFVSKGIYTVRISGNDAIQHAKVIKQ
ncbi:MAG: T9SS type A sorting domain-containing protein [Luteibaculaceae bacterium]